VITGSSICNDCDRRPKTGTQIDADRQMGPPRYGGEAEARAPRGRSWTDRSARFRTSRKPQSVTLLAANSISRGKHDDETHDRRGLLDLHCLHHCSRHRCWFPRARRRFGDCGVQRRQPASPDMRGDRRRSAFDNSGATARQRHAEDWRGRPCRFGRLSPQARIADAGYTQTGYTGEIGCWGTGSAATPTAPLDLWMKSPSHRAIILNCAFTAGGFAIAWDGNKMTAVGDFAGA